MIRVLFFDLDETLVAQEQAFTRAYRASAEWLAGELGTMDTKAFAEAIPIAAERVMAASPVAGVVGRCCFGGRDLLWGNPGVDSATARNLSDHVDAFRNETWSSLVSPFPIDHRWAVAELGRCFRSAMFAAIELFPGVLPTLVRLSKHYRLAAITNGMGNAQREKLAHLGIDGFFDRVIASADVGVGKPSAAVFATALAAMEVDAKAALMVGDSLDGDIRGAQRAGLSAAWLNR